MHPHAARRALRVLAVLAPLVAASAPGLARADEPTASARPAHAAPEAAAAPEASSTWYGWQTLATDGAATALMVFSVTSDGATTKDVLGGVGVGTYALGGPAVHAAHGNWGKGFGSLGVRLGAPVTLGAAGMVIGMLAADDLGSFVSGWVYGAFYGGIAGMVVASAIDASLLARKTESVAAAPTRAATTVRVVPTFAVTRESHANGSSAGARATVGVAATF